jgi:D-glycero-beta-D-manno-heptose-7-phosphate kinase
MEFTQEAIRKLFRTFNTARVLVIGDVMIDSYLIGKVDRISPEAPVPVVNLQKRTNMLGGAANVALNIRSLGAEAILCSVVGNDAQADILLGLMKDQGLNPDGILLSPHRITTTKYRILGNRVQMLRVDDEMETDLLPSDAEALTTRISKLISEKKPDVIILQDYDKGVLNAAIIADIIALAGKHQIPVTVDPKKKNFTAYRGVTLFKPNLKEISEALKTTVDATSEDSLLKAAEYLHTEQDIEQVMITLSEHGVFVSSRNKKGYKTFMLPAVMRSIADVSGAGDTVISVASLCLAAGSELFEMTALANIAGGLVCEHSGVVPVDKNQLLTEAISELCFSSASSPEGMAKDYD